MAVVFLVGEYSYAGAVSLLGSFGAVITWVWENVIQPAFGPPAYLSWVLRKSDDSTTLLEAVNAEIKKFNANGTIRELQIKWFGSEMKLPMDSLPPPNS